MRHKHDADGDKRADDETAKKRCMTDGREEIARCGEWLPGAVDPFM